MSTPLFELQAYRPKFFQNDEALWVYIEGDGLAWTTPSQPSMDPTPNDPLALRLALAHPSGKAAYLARPCQYTRDISKGCAKRFWTSARFSREVVDASNQALEVLKSESGARRISLVGYSGGAAVALLIAARRQDIDRVITVAGNLDTKAWADYHRIGPLSDSLNPADDIVAVTGLRQWHWVGEKDDVMPPFLTADFANRFPRDQQPVVQIEPGFDHLCCWVENWPALFERLDRGIEVP